MSNRLKAADLETRAQQLTDIARELGIIEPEAHFRVSGAYGGHTIMLTGGSLGTGVRRGVFGPPEGHVELRKAFDAASVALSTLYAVKRARRGEFA